MASHFDRSAAGGRNSRRQQGILDPLSRFPQGASRGGRVHPTPEARCAPAKSAGTHRCCRLPPQEGCRPLVHPLRVRCGSVGKVRTTGLFQKEAGLTADVLENRLHKILDTTRSWEGVLPVFPTSCLPDFLSSRLPVFPTSCLPDFLS